MKKIYLPLIAFIISATAMAQTVTIGTSTTTPSGSQYRSPWSPTWGYSYTQTIYLKSEINTAGSIASIRFNYNGVRLDSSDQITVWMGTVTRSAFAGLSDWEPIGNMTQVFSGTPTYGALPGPVTITLTTPYSYNNVGNLVIAVHENKPGFNNAGYFFATDMGTIRTIYRVDDDYDPDPANPPAADNSRTRVGNVQIVFGAAQPVTLSNFSGEKVAGANRLTWTTQSEQNNKGFELQRSVDGTNFTSLGFVQSKTHNGTSNAIQTYSFNDNARLRGNAYYRLKQVDFDGKSSFSKVVLLRSALTRFTLTAVYPNPVKNQLSVMLSSADDDKANISITNLDGKEVYRTTMLLVTGDNKLQIDPSAFSAGIYNIKAVTLAGKETVTGKFVKQ